jgi:hypothetical protein
MKPNWSSHVGAVMTSSLLFLSVSCNAASKKSPLSWAQGEYWTCTKREHELLKAKKPYQEWRLGKFCFLECEKEKLECPERKLTVVRMIDTNNPETYKRLEAAEFSVRIRR